MEKYIIVQRLKDFSVLICFEYIAHSCASKLLTRVHTLK